MTIVKKQVMRNKAQITSLRKDIQRLLSFKDCAAISRISIACSIREKRSEIQDIQDFTQRYYNVSI